MRLYSENKSARRRPRKEPKRKRKWLERRKRRLGKKPKRNRKRLERRKRRLRREPKRTRKRLTKGRNEQRKMVHIYRAVSKGSIPSSLAATSASKRPKHSEEIDSNRCCVLAQTMMMYWLRLERTGYTVRVDVGSMRVAWRK